MLASETPLLLTSCRIEREICADVIVTGIPTVKGLDKLIEILIMLRNDWNQVTDQPYVNYVVKGNTDAE